MDGPWLTRPPQGPAFDPDTVSGGRTGPSCSASGSSPGTAVPVVAEPGAEHGFRVVDLPEVDRAAAIIHHGSMDDVLPTGQALARWIDASGYRSAGYAREVTLEWSADPEQWVTEMQLPIYAPGG